VSSHRKSSTTRRLVLATASFATLALAGACTSDRDWGAPTRPPGPAGGPVAAELVSSLRATEDCGDLVASARPVLELAAEQMWGSGGSNGFDAEVTTTFDGARSSTGAAEDGAAPPVAAMAQESTDSATSLSGGTASDTVVGTNNQELGVDEGDLVKTDGSRIVSVLDGVLRVTVLDGSPTVDGTLDLGDRSPSELFLRGDEALVVSTGWEMRTMAEGPTMDVTRPGPAVPSPEPLPAPRPEPAPFPVSTTVSRVDLADPTNPTVVETVDLEGSLVASRLIDGRARIVLRGEPQALTEMMEASDRDEALDTVAALRAEDLLPQAAVDGDVRELGGCGDVLVSTEPAGGQPAIAPALSTVTVVTVGETLGDLAPVSVQGAADTVYASTDALYVGSQRWDSGSGSWTDLHRFDLTGDGAAVHTGSGAAPGRLLNQFSLSERDGALRVVTTVDEAPDTGVIMPTDESTTTTREWQSRTAARLTVLDTDATLDEIGHIDGLGVGEEVQSVRFVDDLGYVVTFRQTDPLYALDLSDPADPKVLGELKIPGFSEYLHPVGEGLLLGVGREADPTTGRDQGFKVSLFDISDPAAMVEVDRFVVPDGYSAISGDHKAFTWDASRSQAVVPIEHGGDGGAAEVIAVRDGRLVRTAELAHDRDGFRLAPLRSVIVGSDLWTLSPAGLGRSDADAPAGVELLPY